ncbi:MAG TPA: hypothetical protein PKW33_00365 [Anaerolineaceae bacterium]|nr:hypothetical protein [Anaerolineaceae bacterium]HPN50010.1 hypothetical protein [Anaerolineaceae bacterium]
MRKTLKDYESQRRRFAARFERYGRRPPVQDEPNASLVTLLFSQVRDKETNGFVSHHLWLVEDENLKAVYPLKPGDQVEFEALVKRYRKGYWGEKPYVFGRPPDYDYGLAHPTEISVTR